MSKPLELTIYPPAEKEPFPSDLDWPGWDAWRAWSRVNTYEFHKQQGKRLTDAELAAEYWRAERLGIHNQREIDMSRALHRFATHPHYFEATEPESDTE